jgi:hypothetical protein
MFSRAISSFWKAGKDFKQILEVIYFFFSLQLLLFLLGPDSVSPITDTPNC